VTVTGVDDHVVDGNTAFSVQTGAATSGDPGYNGIDAADVSLTNTDNDAAGATVTPTSTLTTTEAGGTATFTVVLTSEPTQPVLIEFVSNDTSEGSVSRAAVSFTAADWNVPQTITVTGVDDLRADGDASYSIVTSAATSQDPVYQGLAVADVSVTNTDNDVAGITVSGTGGLVTTEAGGQASFTVALSSEPAANVTIAVSSSDTTEGTVAPAAVTFTPTTWNAPQTITITGADDAVDDGDGAYVIVTGAASSADPGYDTRDPDDVPVTNADDDSAGIAVSPTNGLRTNRGRRHGELHGRPDQPADGGRDDSDFL